MVIEECARRGIGALTLFAFSSENWGRPREEVMELMSLFVESLEAEIADLHRNGVRVRFIGERNELDARLRASMASSEQTTAGNTRLALQIALSYGGRGDILNAVRRLAQQVERHELTAADIDEPTFASALALAGLAGSGPVHPYRRRAARQQLSAVESRLHRAVFHRTAVAGFRRDGVRGLRCSISPRGSGALDCTTQQLGTDGTGLDVAMRARVTTALALAIVLVAAVLYSPVAVTASLLGVVMLMGGWEWSAFLNVATSWRLLYVLVLGALALIAFRYTVALAPFMLAMGLALLWWVVALAWIIVAPAARRSGGRGARRVPWRCCPPGSRWCESTRAGAVGRSGRCSSWR